MAHSPTQCNTTAPACSLPLASGIGLKPQHVNALLDTLPNLGFVEIHAENYLMAGGPRHVQLAAVREHYALSIHGVGMSIGGVSSPDSAHLDAIAGLLKRYPGAQFSEHLAWSRHHHSFLNDLLPIPYTTASLQRVCDHIDEIQQRLGCRLLLENPATYVEFQQQEYEEAAFISEVIRRSGCGLLLDVNNAYVSCTNHGRDLWCYLQQLPLAATGEIHLAGHARLQDSLGAPLLIDSHDRAVDEAVWGAYRQLLGQLGPRPTLIEWDAALPPLERLLLEAAQADTYLQEVNHVG